LGLAVKGGVGVIDRIKRMLKAMMMTSGLTLGSIPLLALFHFLAPLFAPVVGGYWAGAHFRLSNQEAFLLGLTAAVVVGLPLPLIQQVLGFFSYLSPLAIAFFTIIFAVYTGGLVGFFAWFGSSTAKGDASV
jgi:hypothetical protein